jgi:glyoxylase-like metal-dependent hydrolase (beta-lactamase superfamily II)
MTGPGTNTYLLGTTRSWCSIPVPAIDAHVDAILAAGRRAHPHDRLHPHASGSLAGLAGGGGGHGRHGDRCPARAAMITRTRPSRRTSSSSTTMLLDAEFSLRALHTPGHVSNHYCFLLEEEGMLFAGDHIMNGSTVVIIPPGGDMQAYIASLRAAPGLPVQRIAPGHGEVIDDSEAEIEGLVEHRLARAQGVAGLAPSAPCASMNAGHRRLRRCGPGPASLGEAVPGGAPDQAGARGAARALGDGAWARRPPIVSRPERHRRRAEETDCKPK